MSTRILSVFSLLKRVGFAVLFLGGTACAQPLPDVIWDRTGDGNHAQFGYRIWSMGDQNDDGFQDWAVSASGEYGELPENEARFLLFHGGNPPEATPYMSFVRDPDIHLRYGGAVIGDINGDGYNDWQLTLSFVAAPDSQIIHIFLGGPDADMTVDFVLDARPLDAWVQPLGDINGDGYADIYRYLGHNIDRTDVFFGSTNWDTIPDWVKHAESPQNCLPLLTDGDLNGDGFDDFITLGPNTPGGGIYFGSPNPDTVADQWWNNSPHGATMSADMNGDGRDDIVTRDTHQARIFWGGDTVSIDYAATLDFPCVDGAGLGSVAGVGDFNHDGYEDVVAIDETCALSWGYLATYLGGPWINTDPVFTIEGRDPPLNLVGIFTAKALGDVDGDGVDDFAVGCVNDDNDGRRGRVVIFAGDTTYHVPIGKVGPILPEEIDLSAFPNPFNPTTALSFTLPRSAEVALTIRNVLGQEVESVNMGRMSAGEHRYAVNAERWAAGIYFATLNIAAQTHTTKLLLIR